MEQIASERLQIKDWTLRLRRPDGIGPFPVILMLHGWTGDEDAMWVFAGRLPLNYLLLAPRAPFPAPAGGFSWQPEMAHRRAGLVDDFRSAIQALEGLLHQEYIPYADFSHLRLVGFSQGAALAFTFALLKPGCVQAIAGLSGFLPSDAGLLAQTQPLLDVPVFMAHGAKDELVPLARARQAQRVLQQAGAYVSFCEDDVGHKLGAGCFRNLQIFFERN